MKKILLFIVIGIFLIFFTNITSAIVSKEFIKDNERATSLTQYGKIIIKDKYWIDFFGWFAKDIKEITLIENTEYCINKCYAIKEIKLLESGKLIDDIKFKELPSGKETNIEEYKFYIQVGTEEIMKDVYETICEKSKKPELNGSYTDKCERIKTRTVIENKPIWKEYNGEILSTGKYIVKLEGKKKNAQDIDWVVKTNGVWLNEWAVWKYSFNIDLISYYPFNETSGTKAVDVWGGINGTHDPAVALRPGKIDYGTSYNGEPFVQTLIPSYSKWNGTQFSISVWLNHTNLGSAVNEFVISNTSATGGESVLLYIPYSDSRTQLFLGGSDPILCPNMGTQNWTHFVGVLNATHVSFYKNAVLCGYTPRVTNFLIFTGVIVLGTKVDNTQNYAGMVDELGVWRRALTYNEITELYNEGNGLTIDTAKIRFDYPEDKFQSYNMTPKLSCIGYSLKNMTIDVFDSANTKIYSNTKTVTGVINTSVWITPVLPYGSYNWSCYGYDEQGKFVSTFSNRTIIIHWFTINSNIYNSTTYDTKPETIIVNVTYNQEVYLSSSAYLIYDGTPYLATRTLSGDDVIFSRQIITPVVYSETIKEFFWNFTLVSGNGSIYQISDSANQTIKPLILTRCNATYPTITLNITARNETLPIRRVEPFSFGGVFKYGIISTSKVYNFQNTTGLSEITLCISPSFANLLVDADIDYSATGFSSRSYYLRNAKIDNQTQSLTLYLLDSGFSTSIIVNVRDKFLTNLANHLVKFTRYYPGLNAYYLVEVAKTDDFGNALLKVYEEDVDYRIYITNANGSQIYASNPMRIICTSTPCKLDFITGEIETISQPIIDFENVEYSLLWNNATGYILFEFSDKTGLTQSMRLNVVKQEAYGDITICDNSITSSSGALSCYIGINSTGTYFAKIYRTASPSKYFDILIISLTDTWRKFGTEGLTWMLLFAIVMFFIGLSIGPVIAGIMILVAVIFMGFTGIVYMPFLVIISVAVVVIWFIIKMKS